MCLQQASRLEAMLQQFKSEGIDNVSFIVVNSKHPFSQRMIAYLERFVSFPVYQEREGEEVWDVLQGGKDDMFVYDRCGRLAYYIPFPISLIYNKRSIVRAAILSTYFEEPCGVSCSNESALIDEILDPLQEEDNVTIGNQTNDEIIIPRVQHDNSSDDNDIIIIDLENTYNGTLFDDSIINSTNMSLPIEAWDISKFLRVGGTEKHHHSHAHHQEDNDLNNIQNDTQAEIGDDKKASAAETATEGDRVVTHPVEEEFDEERCPGLKIEDCRQFSRDELEITQHCCTNLFLAGHARKVHARSRETAVKHHPHHKHRHLRGECHNLSRKRCKKLQPVLKCCLRSGKHSLKQENHLETTTPTVATMIEKI